MADNLPSPWEPERDRLRLKVMGKLLEELGECTAALARCLVQGIDECEPVTGKSNRRWLEDELADVRANMERLELSLNLDRNYIFQRSEKKFDYITAWIYDLTSPAKR